MKYVHFYENAASIANNEVQFNSKNEKLDEIRDEINNLLSAMGDKRIGYNYAVGSKGIFFTTSEGILVTENGYGCTTYSELLSNLESILFTLKNINTNKMSIEEKPIDVLTPEQPPVNLTTPAQPFIIDVPILDIVDKFESFRVR